MKITRWVNLVLVFVFLAACGGTPSGTSELPTAPVSVTHTPSAESAIGTFLEALKAEDYTGMYATLAQSSRDAISPEDFAKRYTDALNAMSADTIETSILSTLTTPDSAQAAFRIIYKTTLFGDLQRDFSVNLALENGAWKLQWDDGLILPELAGGKQLITNYIPTARGDIYDRNGNAIVTQTDAYALGLVSGEVNEESLNTVVNKLFQLTGARPEKILNEYNNYPAGLYVPVGEASAEAVEKSGLLNFSGVQASPYTSRFYEPDAGPHVTGYTQLISAEELVTYRRLGYSGAEMIGRTGVEKSDEDYLRGRDAATLYIADADNQYVSTIAQAPSRPADSVYLTIDKDLQEQAQAAMDGLPGAIVVIEVKTGRVLAMVSSPVYDPNLFDMDNYNRMNISNMMNDPESPLVNRATQGTYPLGSVFKVITMAAALESGVFTADSTLDCQYDYTELLPSGPTLHDWTYEYCQDYKDENQTDTCPPWPPSGLLTLPQGLMRSCDPWFYHIGYTLFNQDGGNYRNSIVDMARAFGLGKDTGIGQLTEAEGFIPAAPTDGTDATSIAIGQGRVLVTPVQVAAFMAALGNGGTLYRPQVVEKVQPVSGDPLQAFAPIIDGTLPISAANLQIIRDAMISVVENKKGTAYARFTGFSIPIAAKTGTAESGTADPHAWFAGYSLAGLADKPDIAVAVVVNYRGEGSVWAAPIFRRVMEIYFNGHGQKVYPWESSFGFVNPEYGQPAPTPTPGP